MAQESIGMVGCYTRFSPGLKHPISQPEAIRIFDHHRTSGASQTPEPNMQPYSYIQDVANDNSYTIRGTGLSDSISEIDASRPVSLDVSKAAQQEQNQQDMPPILGFSPMDSRWPTPVELDRCPGQMHNTRKVSPRKVQSSSLSSMPDELIRGDAGRSGETNVAAEEVYLDDKAPAELRRLWTIRQTWFANKGHSMWENIIRDYLGPETTNALSEDKRTQVKASLQMKLHRGILRHGVWPARNKAALLRAYVRWEEGRYNEIFRLFIEELQKEGHAPAYEWRSIHIEAELVKEGLEQKQRGPTGARRRRVQIPARHRPARGKMSSQAVSFPVESSPPYHQHRHQSPIYIPEQNPGGGKYPIQHYRHQKHHEYDAGCGSKRDMLPGSSSCNIEAEQLNTQAQESLTDEQHEQLINECLEQAPSETGQEDLARAALGHLDNSQHHDQHKQGDIRVSEDSCAEQSILRNRPPSLLSATSGAIALACGSASPDVTQLSAARLRRAASC
ncbi:hypothetical protein F5883DRAFT_652904 [Diaporthe sp. PMI_573]|nr:hypothetical protein F5883DRAFT_652904 [Diaporthaceae sp. PMI_573]